MRNRTTKALALAAGISLAAVALSGPANAGSLRQGSTGSSGSVTGSLPGEVLWSYYQTDYTINILNAQGALLETSGPIPADNIFRLINPNGAANGNLTGARPQPVCAMIYVFDDDEEMGECCGCPLTSAQLATFSVDKNLTSDWGLQGGPEGGEHDIGAIAIVAAAPNGPGGTCIPTNVPGYSVTTASNLLGSATRLQLSCKTINLAPLGFSGINQNFLSSGGMSEVSCRANIAETALSDDAGGDPTDLTYLQNQCGALVGNGTGGGVCNCPIE